MIILGLDPGKTGAAVILYPDNTGLVLRVPVVKKPKETPAWTEWAHVWATALSIERPDMAVIESVAARPTQGTVSMFNFGRSLGFAHAIVAAAKIPTHFITPSTWKGKMGLTGADKSASRELARQLLPSLSGELTRVKDDGVAEAALLALYGRRYLASQ